MQTITVIIAGLSTGIAAAWDYLKAYAVDCLLTSFLFCFIGYFNGCGQTFFVIIQGFVGAFCRRLPVALLMSCQCRVLCSVWAFPSRLPQWCRFCSSTALSWG